MQAIMFTYGGNKNPIWYSIYRSWGSTYIIQVWFETQSIFLILMNNLQSIAVADSMGSKMCHCLNPPILHLSVCWCNVLPLLSFNRLLHFLVFVVFVRLLRNSEELHQVHWCVTAMLLCKGGVCSASSYINWHRHENNFQHPTMCAVTFVIV